MHKHILWKGIEYHSLESCFLTSNKAGWRVESTIIGIHKKQLYKIDYLVKATTAWETTYFEINSLINNKRKTVCCQNTGNGNWLLNGRSIRKYKGCIDLDISLTPFTNSLTINRLHLKTREVATVDILYVDILQGTIKPVQQKYTKLSRTAYKFENIPNDFEAVVSIDDLGFITKYPKLFKRISTT